MRLTFVQYGDYREAALNFAQGGEEGYYAQRYSVEIVADIAKEAEDVCVICVTSEPYDEVLPSGVRTIGRPLYKGFTVRDLIALVADQKPTHLLPRSPIVPLLKWSLANNITTLPIMATSFPDIGLIKGWYKYHPVARVLNRPQIEWIGNHNENSVKDLRRIGVDPTKVVPWDWPASKRPEDFEPKSLREDDGPFRMFYAGRIQETKGIGDCIKAIRLMKDEGRTVELRAAGKGDIDHYTAMAKELGVADQIEFLGLIPHHEVLQAMHEHDAVIVPSQHAYPEGLPMTIYDAYCSRSPLIASDHPMFQSKVIADKTALVFEGSDPESLKRCINRMMTDPLLYRRLSEDSPAAWERLQLPVKWGELVTRALRNSPEDQEWRAEYCVASGRYD